MKASYRALVSTRHEYRVLALMLALLHLALWDGLEGALARSLMLAHLGLFLIWQPVWNREMRLPWKSLPAFVLAALGFVIWLDWALMTFWLLLLIGIVGGRVTAGRTDRMAYLGTLVFLITELLVGSVPSMFRLDPEIEIDALLGYGLLAFPAALSIMPAHADAGGLRRPVDFLYGLSLSMLGAILALGSLLLTYYTGIPYFLALLKSIVAVAVFLLAISWLWSPLAGFSGLGQLWQRYLLNIGTPFEEWLGHIARSAARLETPHEFLESAMAELVDLPWVTGAEWELRGERRSIGRATAHAFRLTSGELHFVVYARWPLGTALLLHGKLLMQLVGHFHQAKERERELARNAHLQAVHETGARVTHDIKNLLQSLQTLTGALETSSDGNRVEARALLERQLPHLTRRLQLALDKLQMPAEPPTVECIARDWWAALLARKQGEDIRFEADIAADRLVPVDCFDSVVENLIENARFKQLAEPGVEIRVRLVAREDELRLTVCDSGSAIDPEVARELFRHPVRSRTGLGIGLYQAARQAETLGYRLSLASSREGRVCFELAAKYAPREGAGPPGKLDERLRPDARHH